MGDAGSTRPAIPRAILAGRVIAIGRGLAPDMVVAIGTALVEGGVRAFEITLNRPAGLVSLGALAARFGETELVLGAGTVMDIAAAERAIGAGARFLVMPHLDQGLVEWAASRGVPVFPGAFSPTEILAAWRAGAAAVKLFPASAVGPSFVREMGGPLGEIPLVPTGGVTIDTGPAFIAAGAIAVGMGSWLTGSGDPDQVTERSRHAVQALSEAAASANAAAGQRAGRG